MLTEILHVTKCSIESSLSRFVFYTLYFSYFSRTASMKMENLQEQLINITAHRDEVQAQLEQSQEQTLQYMRSVENLQMVLEQFQRGI